MEVLGGRAQAGGSPPTRVVGATFSLRVPLPSKFGGKYDPASRPSSTPTQLKTGDRRRLTKPGGSKPTPEPKPSKGTNSLPVRRPKKSQSTPAGGTTTFLDRQEYDNSGGNARSGRKLTVSRHRRDGREPGNWGYAGIATPRPYRARSAAKRVPKSPGSPTRGETPPRKKRPVKN